MTKILVYLGLLGLLASCAAGAIKWQKLETPLRQKLAEYQMAGQESAIDFAAITGTELTEKERRELEKSGITVTAIHEEGFSASGAPDSIQRIARFDFIQRMTLAGHP